MAKKKQEIVIDYDEEISCERCSEKGAMDFAGQYLCLQCACNDVFEDFNDNNN